MADLYGDNCKYKFVEGKFIFVKNCYWCSYLEKNIKEEEYLIKVLVDANDLLGIIKKYARIHELQRQLRSHRENSFPQIEGM